MNRLWHEKYILGMLVDAISELESALGYAADEPERQAVFSGNLGILYKTRGELDRAEAMYEKALAIDKELGRKEGMANQYGNLGNVYQIRGELDRAAEAWKTARSLFAEIGAEPMVERIDGCLSEIEDRQQ